MTRRYCPHGCVNGWIEVESELGTACPVHPPFMPVPAVVDWSKPEGLPERIQELRAMPYAEYLQTPEWMHTRREAYRRANWTCQFSGCGARTDLNVHHLTYDHRGLENAEDLMVLCREHHEAVHGIQEAS